jgi:hypothetical protein
MADLKRRNTAALESDPSLIEAHPWRLHAAACKGFPRLAAWLLDHGSDVNSRRGDRAPIDMAAGCAPYFSLDKARAMMIWLREHGAELTPRAAVALGEAEWLRARHAEGRLSNPPECNAVRIRRPGRIAACNNRLDMAELLLDLGFVPTNPLRSKRRSRRLGRSARRVCPLGQACDRRALLSAARTRPETSHQQTPISGLTRIATRR